MAQWTGARAGSVCDSSACYASMPADSVACCPEMPPGSNRCLTSRPSDTGTTRGPTPAGLPDRVPTWSHSPVLWVTFQVRARGWGECTAKARGCTTNWMPLVDRYSRCTTYARVGGWASRGRAAPRAGMPVSAGGCSSEAPTAAAQLSGRASVCVALTSEPGPSRRQRSFPAPRTLFLRYPTKRSSYQGTNLRETMTYGSKPSSYLAGRRAGGRCRHSQVGCTAQPACLPAQRCAHPGGQLLLPPCGLVHAYHPAALPAQAAQLTGCCRGARPPASACSRWRGGPPRSGQCGRP